MIIPWDYSFFYTIEKPSIRIYALLTVGASYALPWTAGRAASVVFSLRTDSATELPCRICGVSRVACVLTVTRRSVLRSNASGRVIAVSRGVVARGADAVADAVAAKSHELTHRTRGGGGAGQARCLSRVLVITIVACPGAGLACRRWNSLCIRWGWGTRLT